MCRIVPVAPGGAYSSLYWIGLGIGGTLLWVVGCYEERAVSQPDSLLNLSISDFLDRLASNAPTPGGGSVAALVGTLGCCLGRMAAALTVGKPKFAEVAPQVDKLQSRLERSAELLRKLVDEDAAAYGNLNATFKLDRPDSERKYRIGRAACIAASVPLETAAICASVAADLKRLRTLANPLLHADVDAGIHLAQAAMHAAAANVRANLPLMSESDAQSFEGQLDTLLSRTNPNR